MSAKEAPVLRKRPEASEKTALSLEARRVSRVLGNCIRHVETAAALPAVLRPNSVSSVVNEEWSQAIKEYQILDGRMKTLEGLEQTSDVGTARARLEEDIKTSVGGLLRAARAPADVTGALRAELGVQVGESESMLIKGLQKFHSQVAERLLSRPDEELHAAHEQVHPAFPPDHQEKRAAEEAATAMMKIDAQVSQVNDQIQQLQRSLTGSSPEEEVSLSHSHIKSSKMRRSGVQQGIEQLNSQLHALMLKNREAEREIQEKNEKVETEIEYLLQTFDDKMEQTQSNLELKREDYKREEEELRKQEKPFSSLEVKCKQIHEKRRLAEEKRREEMKEMELKTKAAGEASEREEP